MDYNIYIHDKTSSQSKPTQARKGGGINTTAQKNSSTKKETSSGGFSLQSLKEGWSNMGGWGKAAIIAYAVKKAVDLAVKVVDTVEPFVTRETGDYRFSITYNNVKQVINNFKNPVGTILSAQTYYQVNRLFAAKQEQQRLLIGDSFVNSRSRKV